MHVYGWNRVSIEKDENCGILARVPDLPGVLRKEIKQEHMKNVKETIQTYAADLKARGDPVPVETIQISV
jgi:predicted RNase H-like HicB family nuclease